MINTSKLPFIDQDYAVITSTQKIGLFDSGVGGLSVLRKLVGAFTHLGHNPDFLYLGDTGRCPYGNRNPEEIQSFVAEIVHWLSRQGAEAIVIACNTSAANALSIARSISSVPVYELITPTAIKLANLNRKVAVLATHATIESQAFSRSVHSYAPNLEVIEVACPELVPLIESGHLNSEDTKDIVKTYIDSLLAHNIEILVLGCTHFPFLLDIFKQLVAGRIQLLDPAEVLLESILPKELCPSVSNTAGEKDSRYLQKFSHCYVTGNAEQFSQVAELCLGYKLGTVSGVSFQDLLIPLEDTFEKKVLIESSTARSAH